MLKITTSELQDKLDTIFPNLTFMEEYIGANEKILVKCSNCDNEWKVIPRSLLKSKTGCTKCGTAEKLRNDAKNNFIKKLKNKDKIFNLIEYIDPKHVIVECDDCGWVRTTATENVLRYDCKRCSSIKANESRKLSIEEFIKRAREVHGELYDYSKVEYINYNTKVHIICPEHGEFWQKPGKHLFGQGCPICKSSSGELIVRSLLNQYKLDFIQEKSIKLYKTIFVDFFFEFEENSYIIEVNGLQHYKPIEFFGGEDQFQEQVKRDLALKEYCNINNIYLFIIDSRENIWENTLKFITNIVPSI